MTLGAAISGIVAGAAVALASAFAPRASDGGCTHLGHGERSARAAGPVFHWGRDLVGSSVLAWRRISLRRRGRWMANRCGVRRGPAGDRLGGADRARLRIAAHRRQPECAPAIYGAEGLLAGRASPLRCLARPSLWRARYRDRHDGQRRHHGRAAFRETVLVWLRSTTARDLYVRPAGRSGAGQFPALSGDVRSSSVPSPAWRPSTSSTDGNSVRRTAGHAGAGISTSCAATEGCVSWARRRTRLDLRSLPHQDRVASASRSRTRRPASGDRIALPLGDRLSP